MFTQGDRQNSDRKPDRLGPPDATPDHFRGQRLLVLCETMTSIEISSGWKDSVLVRRGEVVEVLMDASNPGSWMVHCHIADHLRAGGCSAFGLTNGPRVRLRQAR